MIEEYWTKLQISDAAKYLAVQESRYKNGLVCRCRFHSGTSFRPVTKDGIIKNTYKKTFTTSYRERYEVPAEAYHMSKWLGYTVEFCSDGQWFNIDQWHRSASGKLRHRYLHTAPERDILSSPYDELALLKKRISFSDLAASTQDIICAENPAFERSAFDAWDFFVWGSLADLEALLQKPVKNEDTQYISKTLVKEFVLKIQDQISFFQQTLPHWITSWSPETSVRIIICEL